MPCGSWAAFKRHLKRDEAPCEPCREASRARSAAGYWERGGRARRKARYVSRAQDFGVAECVVCGVTFAKVNRAHIRCSQRCRNRRRRAQEPESPAASPATPDLGG